MIAFTTSISLRPSLSRHVSLSTATRPAQPPIPARSSRVAVPKAMLASTLIETLSPEIIAIVKQSVPAIKKHAVEIGYEFYKTMFTNHPTYRRQFNIDRQAGGVTKDKGAPAQIVAVTNSLIAFGRNIDHMEKLQPSMERIFHKHVSRGVTPDQYPGVGDSFLTAVKNVLGDNVSQDVLDAWKEAFGVLASIYIQNETKLQQELEAQAGYSGFSKMIVMEIEEDAKGGRRISLVSGQGVPKHARGMYVSLAIASLGTMTSMKIVDDEEGKMVIHVPKSHERASKFLLEQVGVGSTLDVSVPCGTPSAK